MHPAAGGDGGLVVLPGVTRPTEEEGRRVRRGGGGASHDLGRVELGAAVELLEGPVGTAQLGPHELTDDGDAREDVLETLPTRRDALRAEDEDVARFARFLVGQAHEVRALPHVAERVEGPSGVREGHLALALPRAQVRGAVEQGRTREVLTLDAEQHPIRAVRVAPHLRVAEVRRVSLRLVADNRGHALIKVDHIRRRDDALGGLALPRLGILVVAGVPQLDVVADLDRGARVGAVRVLVGVGQDRGGVVAPVSQVTRRGVAPVDELARVLGRVLEERVIRPADLDEAVRVVQAAHRGRDVKERVVGILRGARRGLGSEGGREKIFGHDLTVTPPDRRARGRDASIPPARCHRCVTPVTKRDRSTKNPDQAPVTSSG